MVVEYLDAKYGGDKPLLPQDPLQRAKVSLFRSTCCQGTAMQPSHPACIHLP